jgi:hypothetical protein
MSDEAPAEAPGAEAPAADEAPAAEVPVPAADDAAPAEAAADAPAAEAPAPAADDAAPAEAAADAPAAEAPAPAADDAASAANAADAPAAEAFDSAAPADEPAAAPAAEAAAPAAPPPDDSDEDKAAKEKAALKIQALQRGRQTRHVLGNNDLEGARAIFAERHMLYDRHMEAKMLSREQNEGQEAEQMRRQDEATAQAAHKIAQQHQHEEEVAAVRMQSLYRGFRDRKQVRSTRENAEQAQRERIAAETREAASSHQHALEMQTSFAAGGMEKSYITSHRSKDGPARRSAGKSRAAPKAILAPTLVDKKANMTSVQKRACMVLEEMIKKWATSYARSVELAAGAEKTGALEFVALFSKPSKEEPIAWPVVRVYLSMTNDFEQHLVPQVTYHLEGEKMQFDTNTDLGRRFKEAWLDRIVMDKRAIRADMALRRKA